MTFDEYPILVNPIITYTDFCIIEIENGDDVYYFELCDTGMGMTSHPLKLVAHMYYDEFEGMSEDEILDACSDYDISGETDDSQMYMFFKYKN